MFAKIVLFLSRYWEHVKSVRKENKVYFSIAKMGSMANRHMKAGR